MYIVGLQDDNVPKREKLNLSNKTVTGEKYAVLNKDGSTTVHYANGKTETIPPVFKNQGQQQPQKSVMTSDMQIGDRYAVLNDDGSTTIHYADGKTETIPPLNDDKEIAIEETSDSVIDNKVSSDNAERAENVKQFTPYLDKLAVKLNDINKNRNQYSAGEYIEKLNELVKNESIQEMLAKCLGQSGKGLAQSGRIKTDNGTIIALTSRKDIHSGQYYWDITYSSVKAE